MKNQQDQQEETVHAEEAPQENSQTPTNETTDMKDAPETSSPDTTIPEGCEQLAEEVSKWRDTALRTAAEYDNYRKRSVKDREEFARYANKSLLEELLPIIDNFEMGMQMASKDQSSMIYIGMSMVQKQLKDFLDNQGVTPIEVTVGQPFDHNLHEAIQSEPSDQPEGTILRVLRVGYRLKDRLLRPANVVVAVPGDIEPVEEI